MAEPRETTLIQVRVPVATKEGADRVFARNGISTSMAMRVLLAEIARTGRSPFDGIWLGKDGREFARHAAASFSEED